MAVLACECSSHPDWLLTFEYCVCHVSVLGRQDENGHLRQTMIWSQLYIDSHVKLGWVYSILFRKLSDVWEGWISWVFINGAVLSTEYVYAKQSFGGNSVSLCSTSLFEIGLEVQPRVSICTTDKAMGHPPMLFKQNGPSPCWKVRRAYQNCGSLKKWHRKKWHRKKGHKEKMAPEKRAQEKRAQGKNGTGKNGTKCRLGQNGTYN